MIGYLLERELAQRVARTGMSHRCSRRPSSTRSIRRSASRRSRSGRCTPPTRRNASRRERGWTVAPDGDGWRRVVASPVPRSIVEQSTIKLLLDHDVLVVCAGGGGVPVVIDSDGVRHGVEAVVDKDAASRAARAQPRRRSAAAAHRRRRPSSSGGAPRTRRPIGEITGRELHGDRRSPPGSMGAEGRRGRVVRERDRRPGRDRRPRRRRGPGRRARRNAGAREDASRDRCLRRSSVCRRERPCVPAR